MKKTETTMAEAVSEEIATEVPTVEDLQAECKSIHEQNELLQKQYINLQDRYSSEKDSWKKYRRDMLAENEALREHCMNLEHRADKLQHAAEQERSRRVATAPKLVIISAAALALCGVPWLLQKLSVIGPQLAYTLQLGLMMAISWCYALIWDRTRK